MDWTLKWRRGRLKSKRNGADYEADEDVEVTAPDGEVFVVLCKVGAYTSKETQSYELHWLEFLFDKNFSDNKELMVDSIWREAMQFAICGGILGISSGTRYEDRARDALGRISLPPAALVCSS